MSRLMPRPSYRRCPAPHCDRGWWTAHPLAMLCPFCQTMALDASKGWPHVCESGHVANDPGDCGQCVTDRAAKVKRGKERATR
jgi:hypothetical protein